MSQAKVQVPRISDAVAASLERRILEGSLQAGDRLSPERELALELGVSRPTLREAIQKLASKGLLQSRQGGGTYVTGNLEAALLDPWRELIEGHPDLQEDLLDFRWMLESQAAEWAAQRATDIDKQRLTQSFDAMKEAFVSESVEKRAEADIAFHKVIGETAHNALLSHLSNLLLKLMHDHIRFNLNELKDVQVASDMLMSQHDQIYQAILNNEPAAAKLAAQTHINFVRETLAQSMRSVARRETSERRFVIDLPNSLISNDSTS
ncbi:MAG: FCD domain-containing protein [Fluviibacter sp.]